MFIFNNKNKDNELIIYQKYIVLNKLRNLKNFFDNKSFFKDDLRK
jgi:hypothetical protein